MCVRGGRITCVDNGDCVQGGERDVIIVSSCRTQRLGFIVSPRRLNVTITRARHHLFVVGSRNSLSTNEVCRVASCRVVTCVRHVVSLPV
jgi:superfamily I DNA and/or RNA helicase